MTTTTNRRVIKERSARATAFGLLALAAVFCAAPEARAQWATSGNNINSTNTGNVGVGTATPAAKLDVTGNGRFIGPGGAVVVRNTDSWTQVVAQRTNGLHQAAFVAAPTVAYDVNNPYWAMGLSPDGSAGWSLDTWDGSSIITRMRVVPNSGNVGVGTLSPASRLDVSGGGGITLRTNGASAGLNLFDRPSAPGHHLVFQGNGDHTVFNVATKNANVGAQRASGVALWTLDIENTANATQVQLQHAPTHGGVLFTQKFGTGTQGDKKVSLQAGWGQVAAPTQLVLDPSGSVGVGTAAPDAQYKLDVAGDVRVSGNISAKYQDVAEWVPAQRQFAAGTVVVVDAEGVNRVLASAGAYDTSVAGVVSAQPGISLGERGEGKVLVATTGRVKVKVDATRLAVRAGDLLVTSEREGYAMKSEPVVVGGRKIHSPGTIIGKALESLAGRTGEILVLLSLQ